jgi:ribose transport system permease protein
MACRDGPHDGDASKMTFAAARWRTVLSRFLADYGMLLVLAVLCLCFSVATISEQHATGAAAADELARHIVARHNRSTRVLVVARGHREDERFADRLSRELSRACITVVETVKGQPVDVRSALATIAAGGGTLDVIACNQSTANWAVLSQLPQQFPSFAHVDIVTPPPFWWPNFLKADNLLNVANQIAVIAIIAIGMTMVIITAGIDLSVGSLIALSAVMATLWIRELAGAESASAVGMAFCCGAAIFACAGVGLVSGTMITAFGIPPFIATLAMMLIASGLAYILAEGQSVYQVPGSFVWLGRGADFGGIPNAVVLMLVFYVVAHVIMSRTTLGRYIYAVGGNREAARLSGVPVRRVLLLVYSICGALAGLGGVIMASQLKSGSPTYGHMYELYVIAAVVVGGTSLSGGEGKVFGTLIGALIIAVIQNGLNLTGVESYTQNVVLGGVILAAVLVDMLKHRNWRFLRRTLNVAQCRKPTDV